MTKRSRAAFPGVRSENRKSKTCAEPRRSIQNQKWAGLFAIVLALTLGGARTEAQQPPKIGYLASFGGRSGRGVSLFHRGLRDLGYVEEKNILIEYRHPQGNLGDTPELVRQLVQLKVDVLVAVDPTAIRAAKHATKTIPIVMLTNQDPVAAGFVDSLARPGGNVTGITRLTRELSGKRLELLKDVFPSVTRVGVLWVRPTALGTGTAFKNYETAADALKIQLQSLEVRRPSPDVEGAFQNALKARASALVTVSNAVLSPHAKKIADLAVKNRIPSMCEASQYVDAGCLMSYATDDNETYRRVAVYVDKILKGTKPADLPVEQPTKFELVINLKTAKQIGLTIPPNVLARANRVIK